MQFLLTLLAEGDHRFLLIVELQGVAIAGILNDGLDVLQVDQVGAVSLEEAAPGKTSFEFLQCEVGRGFLASGTQVGFSVAAGSVENVTRVVEQNGGSI